MSLGAEEIKPYREHQPKAEQVEAMFDNIAHSYDIMNNAMTLGLHRRWLRRSLAGLHLQPGAPMKILDVATGTGDVALRLAREYPEATVTGIDLSEGMLGIARQKLASHPELAPERASAPETQEARKEPEQERLTQEGEQKSQRVRFLQADSLDMPFADDEFSLLTVAYGVRNFEDLNRGLREFHRVLKPGGQVMVLELSVPEGTVTRLGYKLYTRTLIPLVGRLVSKDRRAYSYLPESIAAMPSPREVERMMEEAGFHDVSRRSFAFGAATCYYGKK